MKKALITGITGQEGDILIALSGSGNSENIIKAIETAKGIGIKTFSGAGFVDYVLMNKSSLSPFLLSLFCFRGHYPLVSGCGCPH